MNTIRRQDTRVASTHLKRSNAGLTLWQVLVIVAILLILAAIAIPCPCGHITKGKAVRAISEVDQIELALTKLFADTGTTDLRAFFDDAAFATAVAHLGEEQGLGAFEASVEIYTYSAYVLLRRGRNARGAFNEYRDVLRPGMLGHLGISYYEDLATDPWGTLYQIYPGPWPVEMGPIPFRTYLAPLPSSLPGELTVERDALTFECLDIASDDEITVGWPAPWNQAVYIWSCGANYISGQANYDPTQEYAAPPMMHYNQS